jgi:hypothetical protein
MKKMVWMIVLTMIVGAVFALYTLRGVDQNANENMADGNATEKPKMEIGDYILYGKYHDVPILWRVVHLDDEGDPVLFSDRIITLKKYDQSGSYNYERSNLRQWLNSDEQQIEWWQKPPVGSTQSEEDQAYDQEKGFLANGNFNSKERSYLKPFTHQVLMSKGDTAQPDGGSKWFDFPLNYELEYQQAIASAVASSEQAYYKNMTERVFLPSAKQLKEWVYDRQDILGESYNMGRPTEEAIEKSAYRDVDLRASLPHLYWFNHALAENSALSNKKLSDVERPCQLIEGSGTNIGCYDAQDYTVGVRPLVQVDQSSLRIVDGGEGSFDKPYRIQ